MKTISILMLLASLALLHGCAAPVVVAGAAGAAGGAMVANDERNTNTLVDDNLIEIKISEHLYDDALLGPKIHINVTSYNGVVLLTGEVLSSAARERAIEVARRQDKVRRIHNEIRVADLSSFSSRTTDTWITSKVKTQMITAKNFDATKVKVVTEARTVYLMGLVTPDLGNQAAEIARHISGVQQVVKLFEYL